MAKRVSYTYCSCVGGKVFKPRIDLLKTGFWRGNALSVRQSGVTQPRGEFRKQGAADAFQPPPHPPFSPLLSRDCK